MYGADRGSDESERTAFRRAEKKYKLYYDDAKSSKRQKQPKSVDFSEVIDFKAILDSFHQTGVTPPGISELRCGFSHPVFCFEGRPGFFFIPGALSIEEQCYWIRESLASFPQPPNRTNHNAIYGPIHNLFAATKKQKIFIQVDSSVANVDSGSDSWVGNVEACKWRFSDRHVGIQKMDASKSISASVLLRKLRWSTLGLQFDWSKRNYDVSLPHNKIPAELCQLAKRMATPAMSSGKEFQPEAAIVNYFALGDMLGGHLDDMEADWSKPIVSISLGCKAIFLLGGKSRDDPPLAMFLRSGDVVLMAGEARECYHGIPRIFTDKENAEVAPLSLRFSQQGDIFSMDYIRTSRININIRQVL